MNNNKPLFYSTKKNPTSKCFTFKAKNKKNVF